MKVWSPGGKMLGVDSKSRIGTEVVPVASHILTQMIKVIYNCLSYAKQVCGKVLV